jgi:pSer/pThr/pTyr-binding forkhead associated (FHA) protein
MSELTLTLVRFGYLAILWIFVLSAVSVIRSDMFGARVETSPPQKAVPERQRPAKAKRGAPRLVSIVEGANSGTVIDLHGTSMTIGRSNDAAIHLDDDYASNRHARLASAGDHWFVEDLGSTNGTYIGAHRISQPTAVSVGTRIRIGKSILEIKK